MTQSITPPSHDRPRSIDVAFDWEGLRLAGTLRLPAGPGSHPIVVMAQGSGAADRTSGGYFNKIQDAFLARRLGTFAFDKPGCGQSTGDWRNYGLSGRAAQLVSAIEWVRQHPATDEQRIGLWGHSQGGWLVQMLVGRRVRVAFAVANSAPTIGVSDQIVHDCRNTLMDAGFNGEQVEAGLAYVRSVNDAAVAGLEFDEVIRKVVEPVADQIWFGALPMADDTADWRHLQLLLSEPFDPVDALGGVECPFLAVYGGLDRLLPPWRGVEESGQALAEAPTGDATVTVFPSGNHRIQDQVGGEFVDGYLDLIADWTAQRVGRR